MVPVVMNDCLHLLSLLSNSMAEVCGCEERKLAATLKFGHLYYFFSTNVSRMCIYKEAKQDPVIAVNPSELIPLSRMEYFSFISPARPPRVCSVLGAQCVAKNNTCKKKKWP